MKLASAGTTLGLFSRAKLSLGRFLLGEELALLEEQCREHPLMRQRVTEAEQQNTRLQSQLENLQSVVEQEKSQAVAVVAQKNELEVSLQTANEKLKERAALTHPLYGELLLTTGTKRIFSASPERIVRFLNS